jgi:hypothetical protein
MARVQLRVTEWNAERLLGRSTQILEEFAPIIAEEDAAADSVGAVRLGSWDAAVQESGEYAGGAAWGRGVRSSRKEGHRGPGWIARIAAGAPGGGWVAGDSVDGAVLGADSAGWGLRVVHQSGRCHGCCGQAAGAGLDYAGAAGAAGVAVFCGAVAGADGEVGASPRGTKHPCGTTWSERTCGRAARAGLRGWWLC